MAKVRDVVGKVRSKNAGPFWLTIDIFCETDAAFKTVSQKLATTEVAQVLGMPSQVMKRFDMPDLNVVKFSLPRPLVQGDPADRDMHGASYANLVAELDLPE